MSALTPMLSAMTILGVLCLSGMTTQARSVATLPAPPPGNGRLFIYRLAGPKTPPWPAINVGDMVVGPAKPVTYFIVDVPGGDYRIAVPSDSPEALRLTLAPGETRYVRLTGTGGPDGKRIVPELVDHTTGMRELTACQMFQD